MSGTAQDGVYEYAMTVPQGAEGGTWTVTTLWLYDQLGNMRFLNTAALQAAGYPTSFTNSGAGDTTAPEARSFEFSVPVMVDASDADQTITVRARITDAGVGAGGSGHIAGSANFQSPSGGQNLHAVFWRRNVCRAPPKTASTSTP